MPYYGAQKYLTPAQAAHMGRVSQKLQAQLAPASDVPAPPPRSVLNPRFTLAGLNRLLNAIDNPPGPEAA